MSWRTLVFTFLVVLHAGARALAAESFGQVTFNGQPVPGATVTATRAGGAAEAGPGTAPEAPPPRPVITVSDSQGVYRFADLGEGVWTIRVEMFGFAPITREVRIPPDGPPPVLELALLPLAEITRRIPPPVPSASRAVAAPGPPGGAVASARAGTPDAGEPAPSQAGGTAAGPRGFQRAAVNASAAPPPGAVVNPFRDDDTDTRTDGGMGAADGLLINGSVNNGAASPFAQARAFGNNRPGRRSLYNGGVGLLSSHSALDARPFSFTGQQAPKPQYNDLHFIGTFGGPIRIPRLLRRGPTLFAGYQRTEDHNATTQSAVMPTALERAGDFSQSRDALGRPVQLIDPQTGQPFAGNRIPAGRLSPQAAALLGYYPQPNADAGGYNFQAPVVVATQVDIVQSRLSQGLRNNRDQLVGALMYQRQSTESASIFAFVDQTRTSAFNTDINYSHRLSPFTFLRTRYQFTRQATDVTPAFADVANVSGLAGIAGNDQNPVNWGPPTLVFSSGVAGLGTGQYARNTGLTNGLSGELFWLRGRHNVTMGGGLRTQRFDVFSQQDARGSFGFTGAATGSDLADFLLGLPQTSAIAFGNPDKHLRQTLLETFLNDDWRVSPVVTLTLGLRWEYESPMTERQGRLVNLDVAPGFAAVTPVLATSPTGGLTGIGYPRSLLSPDRGGLQPRLGLAWRPMPGSSLVVRAGYGIYRNTAVYQSIALLLAQQPPLSTTSRVQTSAAALLTLADGFVRASTVPLNTFAVDPDFRVGDAQNWQVSAQRDLPSSLTVVGTYLGSRGSHLMQEYLPNTYPAGAASPCPACPAGFVYLTSGGTSLRNAGQVQVRRRLRNGFTASAQYTLAKATDDATAFGGAALGGAAIAQNWLDLDAEYGPSNFDQRHLFTGQAQYTTGAGVTGGTLVDGLKGRLLKDWTFVAQVTVGSGLPLTPVYLSPVGGTGVTGSIRASLTGAAVEDVPSGYYLNPAAYGAPVAGQWGSAGRNSIAGPAQFSLNAGVGRTFRWGERFNIDWRFDASNVLNRVTYAGVNTIVGSPQFGLPDRANQMRKLQSSLRVRF